jgi:methionine aminotransferase
MEIKSKLPDIGITIFTVMSQLAATHNAINLSQGFPDFDVHPELVQLVNRYMQEGKNQYAPMQGVERLREQIAQKTAEQYNTTYDPGTEITVTSGATEALFAAISAVVNPDDEVIVFEPAFDTYVPAIRLNGGRPVFIQMKYPEYRIDWNEVQDAITAKTRLLVLNSPHNPSGTALTTDDMKSLKQVIDGTGIFILSDEVYEHIIFDGLVHESMTMYPELAERSFVVSSFGKTYHTTGWKIGYCLAPKALSQEFQRIHQYLTFASNTPIQWAYAEFMLKKEHYLNLAAFYQKKRDRFLQLIEPSRFKALTCRGTYFQMLDFSAITDEGDVDFARRMTIQHGVAAIPPSVFYHANDDHKVLRFCFAKNEKTLEEAAEKLCRI